MIHVKAVDLTNSLLLYRLPVSTIIKYLLLLSGRENNGYTRCRILYRVFDVVTVRIFMQLNKKYELY